MRRVLSKKRNGAVLIENTHEDQVSCAPSTSGSALVSGPSQNSLQTVNYLS